MPIGFVRDDQPRDFDVVQTPSGLWVAGADFIHHIEPQEEDD